MRRIRDFIVRWMGAMVLIVAALALTLPASFVWIDTWAINPMLGIIMFGMGQTLSPADFKVVLSRPKDILIGCLTQFTVMLLLALGLTWAFALPKELAIGVILVGCCPGGTASNVITYLAKGDLALSVGMTAASTLLAPLLTPFLVWMLAGTMVDVDAVGMLMSIVYVVIAPIVCGLLCQRFLPKVTQRVTPYLPAFSSVVIAMVVGIIVSHNADRLLTAGMLVVAVVMIHNLLGLAIGFAVGCLLRLQKPKCVALSIEVGMQNSELASSLAVLHFAAYPLATIPGAVFSVWHNTSGALVAKLYGLMKQKIIRTYWIFVLLFAWCVPQTAFGRNAAYLMVYFKEHGHNVYFAVSRDGRTFTDVNGCESVMTGDTINNEEIVTIDTISQEMKEANMQEVQAYLKECGAFFIATADADQPRVRPFGVSEIIDGKLYIMTGKVKDVYKQIAANGKFEICALKKSGAEWMRLSGTLVNDETLSVKEEFLNRNEGLKSMYKADDDNMAVLQITNATARFCSFLAPERKVNF